MAVLRSRTKPWNTCLDDQPGDEKLFTDHKSESRDDPCNLKFKTTDSRLPFWIIAHKEQYREGAVWDNTHEGTGPRMCVENSETGKLVVKFHNTGIVVIQANFLKWQEKWDTLRTRVTELQENPDTSTYMDMLDDDHDLDRSGTQASMSNPPEIKIQQATINTSSTSQGSLSLSESQHVSEHNSVLSQGEESLVNDLQAKYIQLIDHSNTAMENMGKSIDSIKSEILKSHIQLQNTMKDDVMSSISRSP